MKWILPLFLLTTLAQAETSKLIPAFLEAAEIYQSSADNSLILKPEVRAILNVLHEKNLPIELLTRFKGAKSSWTLPEDDKYDAWTKNPVQNKNEFNVPEISFHATKIDVIDSSQMRDDLYAYFFITDGVVPTGKVTSIYKGIASGQGFFFNATDRAIFPLVGIPAKAPSNHLIIDYGIIESDGDDIKKLQQLSAIIIDIAIAVYASQAPESSQVIVSLRKEIKALADLLLTFNNDDRLVTDSMGFTTDEISTLLKERTFVDFKRNHKFKGNYQKWEYDISFRMVR